MLYKPVYRASLIASKANDQSILIHFRIKVERGTLCLTNSDRSRMIPDKHSHLFSLISNDAMIEVPMAPKTTNNETPVEIST